MVNPAIMIIKILGSVCAKCKALERLTREVIAENDIDAEVLKVDDIFEMVNYRARRTPVLVINEKVAVSGFVPSKTEIKLLIEKYSND